MICLLDSTHLPQITTFRLRRKRFPYRSRVRQYFVFQSKSGSEFNSAEVRTSTKHSAMSSIDPFRRLLNCLNSELTQRNVESLKHFCGIPASQLERIITGWDLFNILIQQDKIGEEPEKMKFLLRIIKELKPKRKKLVRMVEKYIQENYRQPETILTDMESSSENYRDYQTAPRPPTISENFRQF